MATHDDFKNGWYGVFHKSSDVIVRIIDITNSVDFLRINGQVEAGGNILRSVDSNWIGNYPSEDEAESACSKLNEQADLGNTTLGCNWLEYYLGDPMIVSEESREMTGLYARRVLYCRLCHKDRNKHNIELMSLFNPCGVIRD